MDWEPWSWSHGGAQNSGKLPQTCWRKTFIYMYCSSRTMWVLYKSAAVGALDCDWFVFVNGMENPNVSPFRIRINRIIRRTRVLAIPLVILLISPKHRDNQQTRPYRYLEITQHSASLHSQNLSLAAVIAWCALALHCGNLVHEKWPKSKFQDVSQHLGLCAEF